MPAKPAAKEKIAYLAVFGNTNFADNNYFNLSGNGDLFLNTVNFLASEEAQITLRSPGEKISTAAAHRLPGVGFAVGLPGFHPAGHHYCRNQRLSETEGPAMSGQKLLFYLAVLLLVAGGYFFSEFRHSRQTSPGKSSQTGLSA